MKRLALSLLLGSLFTVGCGQSLVELPADDDHNQNPPPAPVLSGILPQRGPAAGGTSVVLTGTNLDGATAVSFGSASAEFTVDSATRITAVSPAGTNSVNVTVVTPGGTSNGLPYAYGNAPAVTGLTPAFGLVAGGTSVVITGSAFTGATSVTFGGTAATSFTVSSNSQITAVAPAHAAGTVQVVVTTDVAESNGFDFTYGELPTLASIAPALGPTTGGTTVTLTGTHLTGATRVNFDTTQVTAVTVVDDTHVTVVTPAHAAGVASVTVTTRFGTSSGVDFTYGAAPTLTSVTPPVSPNAGGANVTIVGANLTDATAVTFGSVAATSFTVVSDTQIDAVAPAGTASVNLTVTTAFGTSNGLPFGYGNAPVQTSLTPNFGLVAGNTAVVITGVQFTGTTSVTFDGVSVLFTIDSDTQITTSSPAHASGAVDVVTTNADGASNALPFTYGAVPALVSVTPDYTPSTGGASVVITGTDLAGTTYLTFGGTPVPSFTVDSATQITAVTPANAAGVVGIVATTPFGLSNSLPFNYGDPPAIISLSPNSGSEAGGTVVTITGTSFANTSAVSFGGTAASFVLDSATQITATAPAGTGSVNVTVTTPYGTSGNATYTYGNAPAITSLSPAFGAVAGGETILINGSNFTSTSTVLFGVDAPAVTFVSDTQLSVTAPAGAVGTVNVTVTSSVGTSNAATYTYVAAPTATGTSPNVGPSAGGTLVTITGTNFVTGATTVTFDGNAATPVTVNSSTSLTVATPAHAAGAVTVAVTTAFGSGSTGFTYVDPPTVTGAAPNTGSTGGTTVVTLTGTNFAFTTGVTFDGMAGTAINILSETSLNVTTPAHAAGPVDIVVTTSGGAATLPNGFTYTSTAPTVTSLTPTSGVTSGGTLLTITGSGFTGATSVAIDGITISAVTVVNDTTLRVNTPAHAAGTVDVAVTTPGGTTTLANSYSYVATVTPGTITGSTNNPGILNGTGLAWLGTDPAAYAVFSCLGNGCDITLGDRDTTLDGPITDTAFLVGSGSWSGYTGAICPVSSLVWDSVSCTNPYFSP